MSWDFSTEMKLKRESPELHQIFSDNVMCCQNILNKYQSFFPNFTDHTVLHSLEVIDFCNELIGSNIDNINADEIFILLMAAYLHDSGMGITLSDFEQFSRELPAVEEYRKNNPDAPVDDTIRRFHNEFSGCFIKKYAPLFDFPSEEYLFSVIQVSRGHRKTDLFDETEYPSELLLPNGNFVHLPYLAALIRLADELDIARDRNMLFLYNIDELTNPRDIKEFKKHMAIEKLSFEESAFRVDVDFSDGELKDQLYELFSKLEKTLTECVNVVDARTPFRIFQRKIVINAK